MTSEKPSDAFPPLLPDDEIDRMVVRKPVASPPRPEAFPIVARAFPRIASRIRELWGTPACDQYLDQLLIDDRGNRQGFPPPVVSALLALSERHHQDFGFRRLDLDNVRDLDPGRAGA